MKNKGGSAEDVFDMVKIRIMKSGVKKNGYFTVRLTVRGGRVSNLGPDCMQM